MSLDTMRTWWSRAFSRRQRGPAKKNTPYRKCFLEILEDRTLLSAGLYTVNMTGDAGASSGQFSGDIRYCIDQADNPNNAGSTIKFDMSALGTNIISLSHNELEISQSTAIIGPGASQLTISGLVPGTTGATTQASRVFNVTSSTANVTISGLTIADGNASPSTTFTAINAGNQGGDIFNGGYLTLKNDVVTNGFSLGQVGAPIGRGGGIFNAESQNGGPGATLVLDGTTVEGNKAQGFIPPTSPGTPGFSAGPGAGGGIYSDTNTTVILENGSQVINNTALGSNGQPGKEFPPPPTAPSGPNGSPGAPGWDGGDGGGAEGGGLYFVSGTLQIVGTKDTAISFTGNVAQGGVGGNGGLGQKGGNATAVTGHGGTGGFGGNAGKGGDALGGAIYAASGSYTIGLSYVQMAGNKAVGGLGGVGGTGATGGNGGGSGNGGIGGQGGLGGAAGNSIGGGLYTAAGSTSISAGLQFSTLSGNVAQGGVGGKGGLGGKGGNGGANAHGGTGGAGGAAGIGGNAFGGGLYNLGGSVTLDDMTVAANSASSGAGGAGQTAGTGGNDANAHGGDGGVGGLGGNAGQALGGGLASGGTGSLIIGSHGGNVFTTNKAITASGGIGGKGGKGGNAGGNFFQPPGTGGVGGGGGSASSASGGAIAITQGSLQISSTVFGTQGGGSGNTVVGGAGGAAGTGGTGGTATKQGGIGGFGGAGGLGGVGGYVYGGAISLGGNAGNLAFLSNSISGNAITAGVGGAGGTGGVGGVGDAAPGGPGGHGGNGNTSGQGWGGGLAYIPSSAASASANVISITSTPFTDNTITGAAGGHGGLPGIGGPTMGNLTVPTGPPTTGGSGGDSLGLFGGGIAISSPATVPGSVTLMKSPITGNVMVAATGGAAATGSSQAGGAGGSVQGAGLYSSNVSLTVNSLSASNNTATAGAGGTGGNGVGSRVDPVFGTVLFGFGPGGPGGNGGLAQGGGVFFNNSTGGPLGLTFTSSSASGNVMQAGKGGLGGNQGPAGSSYVVGGNGGNGGVAQGGGLYALTSSNSVTGATVSYDTFASNTLTAGDGAQGGSGSSSTGTHTPGPFAKGGEGGAADGGGVYNNSNNGGTSSALIILGDTMVANILKAGNGGKGGSGTTNNGGPGGNGGNGGTAEGGGFWQGDNTTLTVYNTTIGGLSANAKTPTKWSNVLSAGLGGGGNNAGTPHLVPYNDGGNGGNGGSVWGAGVYVNSGTATFTNDTIINNIANNFAAGGIGGSGAGNSSGIKGSNGAAGTGKGGGYYAAGGTQNPGNNIIALNSAATNGPDVFGTFASQGNNVLGLTNGSSGFGSSDLSGATAAKLNLGPLQNNGGPTSTNAELAGSIAIGAGSVNLVSAAGLSFDQRGPGFVRIFNNSVDAGAFELQPAVIDSLSPNSVNEGSPTLTLTIAATGVLPGATVSFGSTVLTPSFVNGNVVVQVPASLLLNEGAVNVVITNPDGQPSAALPFTIVETQPQVVNPGTQTNSPGDPVFLFINLAASDNDGAFGASGLPPGLSIDPVTGLISGTISGSASGNYTVTVAYNDDGQSGSTTFVWSIPSIGGGASSSSGAFPIAGLIGLALEEYQLTVDSFLAYFYSAFGMSTAGIDAQIAQLTSAIQADPLFNTMWGQLAIQLGQQAAYGSL